LYSLHTIKFTDLEISKGFVDRNKQEEFIEASYKLFKFTGKY
jgi:hypothetical protein